MTVGLGAASHSRIAVAIDSLLVTKDPAGSYTRRIFQRKAFHFASASRGILVACAGYRKFGVLKSQYDQGSTLLDRMPTFEAIVEMFASFIAPRLTRESIKDRQPQPAEFSYQFGLVPKLST